MREPSDFSSFHPAGDGRDELARLGLWTVGPCCPRAGRGGGRHPRRRQRCHHSLAEEGLSFYPDYVCRGAVQQPRADLPPPLPGDHLRLPGAPDISPEALRRLADRDPTKAYGVHPAPLAQAGLPLGDRRRAAAPQAQTQLLRRHAAAPDRRPARAPIQRAPPHCATGACSGPTSPTR